MRLAREGALLRARRPAGGTRSFQPIPRPGAAARRTVARIRQRAPIQRETAAPDVFAQARLEPLELGDARADSLTRT